MDSENHENKDQDTLSDGRRERGLYRQQQLLNREKLVRAGGNYEARITENIILPERRSLKYLVQSILLCGALDYLFIKING